MLMAIALNSNPYPKTDVLKKYMLDLETKVDTATGLLSEE